jgi:Coenzyme PQQ synthesis protein D (PqqD)
MSERLRLRPDAVAWREVDGEVIALGLESSTYFGTNSSGTVLWRRLAEGTTRAELVSDLMTTFGLEQARAQTDVDAFLDDLRGRGLLEP